MSQQADTPSTPTNAYCEEDRQEYEDELHEIIHQALHDIESAISELEAMQKTTYRIPTVTWH